MYELSGGVDGLDRYLGNWTGPKAKASYLDLSL